MEHYQLIIAYDGTEFSGFQRQKGFRTIQAEIESALKRTGWEGDTIQAAGRTDSGVHATGQVVTFFHHWEHPKEELLTALNYYLPKSIAVQSIKKVEEEFHPRYDACSREYQYAITICTVRQPHKERYMWRIEGELDWTLMQATASLFIGEHDFSQFGKPVKPDGSTIRKVFLSEWKQSSSSDYHYTIVADAFLYHMVRRIVFVMMSTGKGRTDPQLVQKMLDGNQEKISPGIAPACGLTLTKVEYNE